MFLAVANQDQLVIPKQANHCDKHGHDRPGGDASDQNEEQELGDIIPACFRAKKFTAYFVEGGRLLCRNNGRGTRLGVGGRLKGIIR